MGFSGISMTAHFSGLPEFGRITDGLSQRAKTLICKQAHQRASMVVTTAIRALAPAESGLLRSAVQVKTRINAAGTGVYSLIGVSRKVVGKVASQIVVRLPKGMLAVAGAVSRVAKGQTAAGMRNRRPSKYYNLVETGHEGKHGPAAAHPYLVPGWEAAKGQVRQIMETFARQAARPGALGGGIDAAAGGIGAGGAALSESLRKKAVSTLKRAIRKQRAA
jgi:hypothetical protein